MNNKLKFVCIILSVLYILFQFETLYFGKYYQQKITLDFSFVFTTIDFLLIYVIWLIYGIISEKTNWIYIHSTENKIVNSIFYSMSFISLLINFIIHIIAFINIHNIVYTLLFLSLFSLDLAFGGLTIYGLIDYVKLINNEKRGSKI